MQTTKEEKQGIQTKFILGGALLAGLLFWMVIVNWTRGMFVDDALIGLRYVDNLVNGHGFVFNPGDRVEGVTNAGWIFLVWVFSPLGDLLNVARVVGLTAGFLAVIIILLTAAPIAPNPWRLAFLAPLPLLIVTQYDFAFFTATGMETGLAALLLALMVSLAATNRSGYLIAILGAIGFTVRPELILIFPLSLILGAERSGSRLRPWLMLLVNLACIGVITLARVMYFDDILPNTFRAKGATLEGIIERTVNYLSGHVINMPGLFSGVLALALIGFGIMQIRRQNRRLGATLAAIICTGILFCLYARNDWTLTARYFGPFSPIAAFALWWGLCTLLVHLGAEKMSVKTLTALVAIFAIAFIGLGVINFRSTLFQEKVKTYPGYVLTGTGLELPSRWMGQNLPPNAIIATRRIGAVAYFSKLHIWDYAFGLTEPEVAKIVKQHKSEAFSDPADPMLKDVWQRVRPDYLLEDYQHRRIDVLTATTSHSEVTIHGFKYVLMASFPLNRSTDWALWKRID
ncbi:hypothetical protein [Propionivibrio sp.]|uniref:hypothetical protein n=2 Tax=Propionivibrio sp. TaxID=2212460 RepID=UPI0025D1542E|nr:hypothetical protein [Propionivibrio sp.]MBK7357130.1 hypothetical protein [Propionivibrio sp.]MBK8745378.1 hypothetical protein [Propionivibrio sp.]